MGVIVITLLTNWGYISLTEKSESMMTNSMGNMMSSMHLKNIKLSTLFVTENQNKSGMSSNISTSTSTSHDTNVSYKKRIHYITTIIIIVLLPLIIAGTVFLSIIWIK